MYLDNKEQRQSLVNMTSMFFYFYVQMQNTSGAIMIHVFSRSKILPKKVKYTYVDPLLVILQMYSMLSYNQLNNFWHLELKHTSHSILHSLGTNSLLCTKNVVCISKMYLLVSNALVIPFSLIILLSYQYYVLEKHLLRVLMASTSISYVIYVYSECQYNVRGLPTQIFHVLFKKKRQHVLSLESLSSKGSLVFPEKY